MKDKAQAVVVFPDGRRVNIDDLPPAPPAAPIVNPLFIKMDEAVARCGISKADFKALVKENVFPSRMQGSSLWDRKALYKRLDELKLHTSKVEPGYVYFMEMGDFIKIGWSTWPQSRRDTLQSSNPYDIKILGAVPGSLENEAWLHTVFAHVRGRGEWFRKSPGLLAYIAWLKIAWRGDARVIRGDMDNVLAMGSTR